MTNMRILIGALSVACVAAVLPAVAAEMVKYEVKDYAIAKSLTGKKGDPFAGRKAAINRRQGNCLACHHLPAPEQAYHGNIGPSLVGVANRYKEGELRLRIVNSKAINEATSMPGFYRTEGLHMVKKQWKGKTLLTAEQVEDVLAYLLTLRNDTTFRQAFAWARKAKLDKFEWRGKVYSAAVKSMKKMKK
jgi:sulfur-oxidizing protein SoxX